MSTRNLLLVLTVTLAAAMAFFHPELAWKLPFFPILIVATIRK